MEEHICPVWVGHLLANPLRKLVHNPRRILSPHVRPGMTVLDLGCAMGFFTLPLARMVGSSGRVVGVDLQPGMIRALERRARREGLDDRISARQCDAGSLGLAHLAGGVDFALAFAVVHEVGDARAFFTEVADCLRPGGRLLLAEPKGHVSEAAFRETVAAAEGCGFELAGTPSIFRSRVALLRKGPGEPVTAGRG